MSKLVENLQRISKAGAQSMGFRAGITTPKTQSMVLIASLPQLDADAAATAAEGGADAVLVCIRDLEAEIEAIQHKLQAVGNIPWGASLEAVTNEKIKRLLKMGCDFLIVNASMPAAVLQQEGMGKVLEIDPSLDGGSVRAIDKLPVDIVLINWGPDDESLLTMHHLMVCQRLANLVRKPLLAVAPSGIIGSDLQGLWEAGVNGIVIRTESGFPKARLLGLRQAIDALPPAAKRQRVKTEALLPTLGERENMEQEEEEV